MKKTETARTETFEERLAIMAEASAAAEEADFAYGVATNEYEIITAAYNEQLGISTSESLGKLKELLRRYAPKAAMWFGGPAAGVAATAFLADSGGFSKLRETFGGLLSVFGVG